MLRAPESDFLPWDTDAWEYRLDRRYLPTAVHVAGFRFMAVVELEPSMNAALWTCQDTEELFRSQCENVLRLMAAYRMLALGGVLLHCAAIARDDCAHNCAHNTRALVFAGRSGAGKTTLCRMAAARGWRVLSDDLNVLRAADAGLEVEQVPFAGDFGPAERLEHALPVAALARLRHADREELTPLSGAGLYGTLLAASPYVNRDPYREARLLDLLERLTAASGASFELRFALDSRLDTLTRLVEGEDAMNGAPE